MTLAVSSILSQAASHAKRLGLFKQVMTHEPKSAPRNGLTACLWVNSIAPVPGVSGLAATSGRVELSVRIYESMLSEPQDAIDVRILGATEKLMAAYSGDFTLGGEVMEVDLLGAHGTALSAEAGYLNQDGKLYRVMVITLPLIISDIWNQIA
ncbi:hypothetical protein ACFO9E_18165 [Streptomyces maoxianensis]|uniref:Uncharacterized protein n=1 Tax=Streptomyces maoxianensis TaxID=1459942 RepID=A0ABV9G9F3_9ACTN